LGYRFDPPLQLLDVAKIQTRIQTLMAGSHSDADLPRPPEARVTVLTRTDSTNQQLLAADVAADPQVLLAEMQTAGRGRRGREWRSPFGVNLYLSLSWSFPAWPPTLGTLPLACGVACARALRAHGLPVAIKWPNDLRIDGRKLGGILVEQRGEAGGVCRVVVGVGLNHAMLPQQAAEITQPWTSIHAECARLGQSPPERNQLAATLIAELLAMLHRFEFAGGFEPFRQDWARFDETADKAVRIHQGDAVLEGIARGIDTSGALLLEIDGERRPMLAGDVSLRFAESPSS